jgi:hypothetical protein
LLLSTLNLERYHMSIDDKKVIGYIAKYSRTEVLFVGEACLIMGSEKQFQDHISKNVPEHKTKLSLKKIRFADIIRSINNAEKIILDEESYKRFRPLGKKIGLQTDIPSSDTNETGVSNFYLIGDDGLIKRQLS